MKFQFALAGLVLTMVGQSALALDSCGGQTSRGNPYACCPNGGTAEWWAWKKASDSKWSVIPTGNANTWDNSARSQPSKLTLSTTPAIGSMGVKESSPYCVTRDKTLSCTSYKDTGHIAYVTGFTVDSAGKKTGIRTSEMMCSTSFGPTETIRPLNYFSTYVTGSRPAGSPVGQDPVAMGCVADQKLLSRNNTPDSQGNAKSLYFSEVCNAYWSSSVTKGRSVTAGVTRQSDAQTQTRINTALAAITRTVLSPMIQAKTANDRVCASLVVDGINVGASLPDACNRAADPVTPVAPVSLNGAFSFNTSCEADRQFVSMSMGAYKDGNKITLYKSPSCGTYWASLGGGGSTKSVVSIVDAAQNVASATYTFHFLGATYGEFILQGATTQPPKTYLDGSNLYSPMLKVASGSRVCTRVVVTQIPYRTSTLKDVTMPEVCTTAQ